MNKFTSRILSTALSAAMVVPAFAYTHIVERSVEPSAFSEACLATQRALPKGVRELIPDNYRPQDNGMPDLNAPFVAKKNINKAPKKVQPLKEDAELPTIIGGLINPTSAKGLYTVPVGASQELTQLISGVDAMGGGVLQNGIYYATNYSSFWGMIFVTITGYDVDTKEKVCSYSPDSYEYVLRAAAVDPLTDTVYAVASKSSGSGQDLVTIEYSTTGATVTRICDFPYWVNSIAIDSTGQMYAIFYVIENDIVLESGFVKVNKATGEVSDVGPTNVVPQFPTAAVIDPKTNIMYWELIEADDQPYMCTVDLTSGAVTPILELPKSHQFKGLFIYSTPEAKAPSAPTNVVTNFADGSLAGTISFTVPATYFDGSEATGEVTYTVLANGAQVASGTTAFGSDVEAPVELPAPGNYKFMIYTTNDAGDSPKAYAKGYFGFGVPTAPKPAIAYVDGAITISWDSITTSIDGGYIDVDAMTYTIKNLGNNEIVADKISETTWSVAVEEPEDLTVYSYSVAAVCNGIESEAVKVSLILGSVVPPYANNLSTQDDLDMFTLIDGNGDGKSWHIEEDAAWCDFNAVMAADDWLISVPLRLEANTAYYVSLEVGGQGTTYPEKFEVCSGRGKTAADMTSVIIAPTEVRTELYAFNTYGGYLISDEAGLYYLGIHAISARNMYALRVKNLNVAEGRPSLAPGKASDLNIVPATYGSLFATITFNAPTKSIAGSDLSEITKIELARNGEVVAEKYNVTPGAAIKMTDSVDKHGVYTYTVTAYNTVGTGETISKEAYIGVPVPAPVSSVDVESNNPDVTLTWPAVNRDIYDNPISTEQVTYNITNEEFSILAEGLTETTWSYTYTGETQEFLRFGIQSVTEGGRSQAVYPTPLIAMGPAYPGMKISFPDGTIDGYVFYTITTGGGTWLKCSDDGANNTSRFEGIRSYDGDNGFLAMQGKAVDNSATLVTGIISLENTENPGISFYTYVIYDGDEEDANEITIGVSEPNTYDFKPVKTIVAKDLGQSGWRKATVKLDEYAGKQIQIAITATTKSYAYTPIDNIEVGSLYTIDLAAQQVLAPSKVVAGNDYAVDVEIVNDGINAVSSYSVELYADGELVDTKTGENIDPEQATYVEFTRSFTPFATDAVMYMAKVIVADDQYTYNNTTAEIVVEPVASTLPTPGELKGEATDNGNILTWSEPDLSDVLPDPTTETFEDADSFAQTFKDWLFVDLDGQIIGGFGGFGLGDVPTYTGPSSWFVFDASNEQYVNNTTFWGPGGKKDLHYLCALFNYNMKSNNDWAISPELYGTAQTISLDAKGYATYTESLEVWYSTGSIDPADFIQVGETVKIKTNSWAEYSFDLPEGAKRFAIRCCSNGAYALFVDNVKYIPAGAVVDLTIAGYDVYRDGVKLNSEVITETTFTDTEAQHDTAYTYNVVTIYTRGASIPSNDCELTTTGLDDIFGGINIAAGKGEVIITGAEGMAVQVVAVDGKVLFSGIADTKTTVAVLPGVYVVKAGDKIAKLLVR